MHTEWVTLGAHLRTEAHRHLLFAMREFERDPSSAEEVRARREAKRLELQRVLHTPVVFLAPDGSELDTWFAEDEEVAAKLGKLERRRKIGMMRAIVFVVGRVEAFLTFESISIRTPSIAKNVRGGVRLRTLMTYEMSIRGALRAACPELHDDDSA